MSAIFLQNAIVHYEVLGRGKPVIFLHSWVGSWHYWISTMQATSNSHRVYALDFWGFGDSARALARYSLEQQLALLDGFISLLGIRKCTLVGHGLGSILALYYAGGHPENIERMMLVSFPMGLQSLSSRLVSGAPGQVGEWLAGRSSKEVRVLRSEASKADARAISSSIDQFGRVNWRQLVLQARMHSFWVFGRKDPLVFAPSNGAEAYLPEESQFLFFERCGHYPMLEEPRKFNRLLADFLAQAPETPLQPIQIKEEWRRRVR